MRKQMTRLLACMLIALYVLAVFGEGYADDLDVTLIVNPKATEVYEGRGCYVEQGTKYPGYHWERDPNYTTASVSQWVFRARACER